MDARSSKIAASVAMAIIKLLRLFHADYKSFSAYARARLRWKRQSAYRRVDHGIVCATLYSLKIDVDKLPLERQARELVGLTPEQQFFVWKDLITPWPPTKDITKTRVAEKVTALTTPPSAKGPAPTETQMQAVKTDSTTLAFKFKLEVSAEQMSALERECRARKITRDQLAAELVSQDLARLSKALNPPGTELYPE